MSSIIAPTRTHPFFAFGPRPADRASRPRTIPIAAQLRKASRAFVQSGFYEVEIEPAIRATLCHATAQNPPDSSGVPVGFESCALGGGRRLLQQNRHITD